jgi:hypothetical protein
MEMRLRQANPANLDAFFTNLRTIWLESRGRNIDQHLPSTQSLSAFQPQTAEANKAHDFIIRLARDLQYSGISMDNKTLEKFIYEELNRRLGAKTAHIRKSALPVRSTNATKKVIKKIVPKNQVNFPGIALSVQRLDIQRLIVLEASGLKRLIMHTRRW